MLSTWRSNRSAIFCINLIKTDTSAVYVVIQIFTRNDTCFCTRRVKKYANVAEGRKIEEYVKTDFQLRFAPTYGFQIYVMVMKYLLNNWL